jgi:peptide/nickel transport system permease protein
MFKNKLALLGAVIIGGLVLTAIFAELIAPYNPLEQNIAQGLRAPNTAHWCGQDKLGRDLFSRILYGSRISLWVGISTVSISLVIGLTIGSISGFTGV